MWLYAAKLTGLTGHVPVRIYSPDRIDIRLPETMHYNRITATGRFPTRDSHLTLIHNLNEITAIIVC